MYVCLYFIAINNTKNIQNDNDKNNYVCDINIKIMMMISIIIMGNYLN